MMKKVYLLSWKPGFLAVPLLKEIVVEQRICGLRETKNALDWLRDDKEAVLSVDDDKLELLTRILDRHLLTYKVE